MEEAPRKWRFGKYRWIVLACMILMSVAVSLIGPVRPHIQVAPERLSEHPLFTLPWIGEFYLTNTLTSLLVVDVLVILLALGIRNATRRESKVPGRFQVAVEFLIETVYNLTESSTGKYARKVFPYFMTILIIVLISNLMALIPGMESIGKIEPYDHGHELLMLIPGLATILNKEAETGGYTLVPFFRGMSTDLNFTAALALISVVMTQVIGVQAQGPGYFLRFFNVRNLFTKPFFGAMDFLVSLLELISEFAKLLSFSFRLFGNLFAGMVLTFLIFSLVPLLFVPAMIMMFEFFIGLIQAFVFGMLTMVFMSQAVAGHGGEEEHAH